MKAILISLMIIAVVGGMVGSGLFAYFSDTETSGGNTFQAGTIDITVDGTTVFMKGTQDEFKPCEWGEITKTICNVGMNPADVYKHITSLDGAQGTQSEPETEIEGSTPILPTVADFFVDLTVDGVVKIPADDTVALSAVMGKYIYLGELAPGASMTIVQSLHLKDTGVPQNGLQGDIATLNEEFVAYQVPGDVVPDGDIYTLP